MIRAFVAVPVEDPVVKRRLAGARSLLPELRGLRWIPEAQLHFTLKFLGDVDEDRIGDARAATLAAARGSGPPFRLALGGLGLFPPRGPARVVWAGCRDGTEALVALAAAVDEAFASAGFPTEPRPFSAHLTIARVRDLDAGRRLSRFLPSVPEEPFGAVTVSSLVLFRSDLAPRGPDYTELLRAAIESPAAPQ